MQKGAVRLDGAFSVTRLRELEHEDKPPFIETEFATSRCCGDGGNRNEGPYSRRKIGA